MPSHDGKLQGFNSKHLVKATWSHRGSAFQETLEINVVQNAKSVLD